MSHRGAYAFLLVQLRSDVTGRLLHMIHMLFSVLTLNQNPTNTGRSQETQLFLISPNPETFDPQRWLDPNGDLRTDIHFYNCGFGRRDVFVCVSIFSRSNSTSVHTVFKLNKTCPGLHIANRSLYINSALLLWSFRILERPDALIDANGFTDSIITRAPPFEAEFVPRMEEKKLREIMGVYCDSVCYSLDWVNKDILLLCPSTG
jgi:hypothetical protein